MNLFPDTLYNVEISYYDSKSKLRQNSPIKLFRTFPNNSTKVDDFNLVFGGNIGNLNQTIKMHKVAAKLNPYAVFIGGDIVFDSGFEE